MQAKVGDRLVVKSRHVGEQPRDGEIIEVHGEDGGPFLPLVAAPFGGAPAGSLRLWDGAL